MFTVKRSAHNPILKPFERHPWEAKAVFNWSPVVGKFDRMIHVVYRALSQPELVPGNGNCLSTIGYTKSRDGIHYAKSRQLIKPEYEWERYGCEDPRVTAFNGKYYIFYTALSTFPFKFNGIKVACAITRDFKTIEEKHLVTPFNAKAMALFPSKIDGKMMAVLTIHTDHPKRMPRIVLAAFDREEDIWNPLYWEEWHRNLRQHALPLRRTTTDHVEVGAQPIKTEVGWLLIYAHIQNYRSDHKIFGIEAVLLDLKNPKRIVGRTRHPILVPETSYEQYGDVPYVIFPSGAMVRDGRLWIFYGATDTTCCIARLPLHALLESMQPRHKHYHVVRAAKNPIIAPVPHHDWESFATFNPAAIELDGKIHILYRAMSQDRTSTIGYAVSRDGVTIDERLPEPIYHPRAAFEAKKVPNGNSGCEDARIVQVGETLYMFYTAYNGVEVPRVALSSIAKRDFLNRQWNWSKPVLVTPPGIDDKDACIFPEKFQGNYLFIHRIQHQICVDWVRSLDRMWEDVTKGTWLLGPRYGMWDSKKIGLAGPPVKTEAGWILFYHGIGEDSHYRLGAVLLDLKNPMVVLGRTNEAILEPEERYEREGDVPNVVFPCGHVCRGDTIYHYYGGGDSVVAVATMKLSKLLAMLCD